MTVYEVPITPGMPQNFTVTMNSVVYNLRFTWCDPNQCWSMDINDSNNNPIVNGVPLVTSADLLEQYGYLGIGGQMIVQTDTDPDIVPGFYNLGVGANGHLYFISDQ